MKYTALSVFQVCSNARFSEWSQWEDCSESCGGGIHMRRRTCLNGEIGNPGCVGNSEETGLCNSQVKTKN